MKLLCIQIQPERFPAFDEDEILYLFQKFGEESPFTENLSIERGDDNGPYINLLFQSDNLEDLWQELESIFYNDETIGSELQSSSIATCEGDNGWNDFVLLYTFDIKDESDD